MEVQSTFKSPKKVSESSTGSRPPSGVGTSTPPGQEDVSMKHKLKQQDKF